MVSMRRQGRWCDFKAAWIDRDIVWWKMACFDTIRLSSIDIKVIYVKQAVDDLIIDVWIPDFQQLNCNYTFL